MLLIILNHLTEIVALLKIEDQLIKNIKFNTDYHSHLLYIDIDTNIHTDL